MNEDAKIQEAEYFLSQIIANADLPDRTRFYASGFLTAARTAVQYALNEAQGRPGGQEWFDRAIAIDSVVAFLREHRNTNIHERPAPMRTNIFIEVPAGTMAVSNGTSDWIPPPVSTTGTTRYTYEFKGWSGAEDVVTLCARYLAEVRRIVADGRNNGFLTSPP